MSDNLSKTQQIHLQLKNIEVACEQSRLALESVSKISDTVNDMSEKLSNLETESRIYRLQHHGLLNQHNGVIFGGAPGDDVGLKTRTDRLEQRQIDLDKSHESRKNGLYAVGTGTCLLILEKFVSFFKP